MKRYYRIDDAATWEHCIPPCFSAPRANGAMVARPGRGGSVRLAGAGVLVAWKRWHLMLEALAALPPAARARLHFTHIGGSDGTTASVRYADALRKRTMALGLGDQVEWRGEQLSSRALIEESDCAVVLSRDEPFSMVMLEALAIGVPVLASEGGGPADVLQPGVTGWFFQPDDAADLARQLRMLVETDALQKVEVTRDAIGRCESGAVADEWTQVYERLSPASAAPRATATDDVRA
jgi:glycosyltransferase involved in cell wall biosynthesis